MKVVCISDKCANPRVIMPKIGEIVTVLGECSTFPDSWDILEYPLTKYGLRQSINKRHFRPIDYSFGEEVAEKIEKELIEEPALV